MIDGIYKITGSEAIDYSFNVIVELTNKNNQIYLQIIKNNKFPGFNVGFSYDAASDIDFSNHHIKYLGQKEEFLEYFL